MNAGAVEEVTITIGDVPRRLQLRFEEVQIDIASHALALRWSVDAERALEERFGPQLKEPLRAAFLAQPVTTTVELLRLALCHERVDGDRITDDWLLDHADSRQCLTYVARVSAAREQWVQAFLKALRRERHEQVLDQQLQAFAARGAAVPAA